MNLNQIQNVFFIGIGGIGMSALARYFHTLGKNVAGYDKTPTELTSELIQSGILIHFEDQIDLIPTHFTLETTLVVVTPAVPKSHSQWNFFMERNFDIKKRAEVLGIITKNTFCFAVAGTHGKTTTSGILAHILFQSGVDVTSFLGGILENYDSNLVGNGKTVTVVEADEFDRSFLHLHPNIACITSMDADHLDIYGNSAAIEASFTEFASKIEESDNLFITTQLPLSGQTVGVIEKADFSAQNIRIEKNAYIFDIKTKFEVISDVHFALPGRHNLMNALMAFAMAKKYGVSDENSKKALASFKGIRRRFSYQIQKENLVYIDDYAHHPTEIDAVHQAVSELYPGQKVLAIFQPHLFSRTRDFAADFAKSLSAFDSVLLLDIYPARELPMEGITSEWLLNQMTSIDKKVVNKNDLIHEVLLSQATVYISIGAGDIGALVPMIKTALNEKN